MPAIGRINDASIAHRIENPAVFMRNPRLTRDTALQQPLDVVGAHKLQHLTAFRLRDLTIRIAGRQARTKFSAVIKQIEETAHVFGRRLIKRVGIGVISRVWRCGWGWNGAKLLTFHAQIKRRADISIVHPNILQGIDDALQAGKAIAAADDFHDEIRRGVVAAQQGIGQQPGFIRRRLAVQQAIKINHNRRFDGAGGRIGDIAQQVDLFASQQIQHK